MGKTNTKKARNVPQSWPENVLLSSSSPTLSVRLECWTGGWSRSTWPRDGCSVRALLSSLLLTSDPSPGGWESRSHVGGCQTGQENKQWYNHYTRWWSQYFVWALGEKLGLSYQLTVQPGCGWWSGKYEWLKVQACLRMLGSHLEVSNSCLLSCRVSAAETPPASAITPINPWDKHLQLSSWSLFCWNKNTVVRLNMRQASFLINPVHITLAWVIPLG